MKRIVILIGAVLTLAIPAFSQQLWTGNALGGSASDFNQTGMIAASNSFPVGSQVDVTNPQTGQSVRVTITSRVSDPGVFLLLGEDAAAQLGVDRRYPIIVQASPAGTTSSSPGSSSADLPFSTDPDLNPAASLGDPNDFLYDPGSPVPSVEPAATQPPGTLPEIATSTPTVPETSPTTATTPDPQSNGTDPLELNTTTGRVLAEEASPSTETPAISEPVQPIGPVAGISSALQSFREPTMTNEHFMAGRLADRAAEAAAAEAAAIAAAQEAAAREAAQQAETERLAQQAAADAAAQEAETAVQPTSDDGIQPITPPESNETDTDLRLAEEPESPDTSLQPVQDPAISTADPAILEPQVAQAEATEQALVDGYAAPILGDPAADALGAYSDDFAGRPLDRTASGSMVEPALAGTRPAPGDSAAAITPAPQVSSQTVEGSSPSRVPVQSAADFDNLPIARFTSSEETFDDLLARQEAPAQQSVAHDLPMADGPSSADDTPNPSIASTSAPSGIDAGIGTAVPNPNFPIREGQVDPSTTAPSAPQADAIAQDLPQPQTPGQDSLDPSIATGTPEEGTLLITLEPAEFRPPQAEEANPSLPLSQAPEAGIADAQLAQPVAELAQEPETLPNQGTEPSGPDAAIGPASAGANEEAQVALGSPALRDPESIAAPNPESETALASQLSEPTVSKDSAADLMAYLEADPEEQPEAQTPPEPQTPEETVELATSQPETVATTRPEPEAATETEASRQPTSSVTLVPAGEQAPSLDGLVLVETLQQGSYYVQLGAFSNPDNARTAVSAINPGYPLAVQPIGSDGDRKLYRLFIGPLNEDEKGTALFWFRAKGYRDAFIRDGGMR